MTENEQFSVIEELCRQKISEIHTALPGKVILFNPILGTAMIKPSLKYYAADGSTFDYPIIPNVPVFMPRSTIAAITYPVMPGDDCLLICCERSLDEWMLQMGANPEMHDPRQYDLSDCFAFVGMRPVQNIDPINVNISNGATIITVTPANLVNIIGNVTIEGVVTVTGDVIANGRSLTLHKHKGRHGPTSVPI